MERRKGYIMISLSEATHVEGCGLLLDVRHEDAVTGGLVAALCNKRSNDRPPKF